MNRTVVVAVSAGLAACTALLGYARLFRPWQLRWGATDEEVARPMLGDGDVERPQYVSTRAITVNARPDDIFPWLVQMGYRRGGLYSYDFLDRVFGILDAPSAREILPAFQHLEAGDVIPVGGGGHFPVRTVERDRCLHLGAREDGVAWTWVTELDPVDGERTRLITRNRVSFPWTPGMLISMLWLDLAAFVMVRRWLVVLKGRAEGMTARRRAATAGPRAIPQAAHQAADRQSGLDGPARRAG